MTSGTPPFATVIVVSHAAQLCFWDEAEGNHIFRLDTILKVKGHNNILLPSRVLRPVHKDPRLHEQLRRPGSISVVDTSLSGRWGEIECIRVESRNHGEAESKVTHSCSELRLDNSCQTLVAPSFRRARTD